MPNLQSSPVSVDSDMKQIRWINVMVRTSLLLLLFVGARLSAATYYVSNTGSDSANGSAATPWQTLNLSIPKLNAGDTLNITGTFAEQNGTGEGYTFTVSGTANNPITLLGVNGIIDIQTGGDNGNYNFNGNYIVIDGLKVTSSLAGGVYYGGAFGMFGSNCIVRNCELHDIAASTNGGGDKLYCILNHGSYNTFSNLVFHGIQDGDIFRIWGHNNLITHCTITNCTNPNYSAGALHADLIQFWGPEQSYSNVLECSLFANCTISGGALSSDNPATDTACTNMNDWVYRNNVFANNGSQAIQCAADHMKFYNNTFYNWPRAIDFWAVYYDNFVLENNVFINCGILDSYGNPATSTFLSNSWDSASSSLSTVDMRNHFATNNLITNPGFVNTGVDFHLLTNSVLRNAGANLTTAFTTDKDGNPRPASGAWDIGAYEFSSASPNTNSASPVILVSTASLDFGTVLTNTGTNLTLTVQNTGGGTMTGSASVLAPFQIISGANYSLGSNQTQTVTVGFNPTAAGTFSQPISFTGASGASATLSGLGFVMQPSLSFNASAGTILTPFTVISNYVSQSSSTGLAGSGEAVYGFSITSAGNYVVSANVNAPSTAANSFYVNIDGQPTDPTMIWDSPVTSGFTNLVVSWRGTGTETNNQFVPEIFNLSAGTHALIVRGREGGTQLAGIAILQMPPAPQNLRVISP